MDRSDAQRWESYVSVGGMHCAACAETLEHALLGVAGVESASVNAVSRRARVTWDARLVKPAQWFRACAAAGYELLPETDSLHADQERGRQRLALWRWLVATLCMMQVMMYAFPAYIADPADLPPDILSLLRWASWVLTLPVLIFACGPFFQKSWRDLRARRIGMDLTVSLGIAVMFAVSSAATFDPDGMFGGDVYFDSLTMFVFFLLTGRWLEMRLHHRNERAIATLIEGAPQTTERRNDEGVFERVPVHFLKPGDRVRVLPGEAFPADGLIIDGSTFADEALLTGESRPISRPIRSKVLAGSFNITSAVEVVVEALGRDSRIGQIADLIREAAVQKPRLAVMADRIAAPFLYGVIAAAAGSALYWWPDGPLHAIMVAVAVLIVTCPCALSLATPAAMLTAAASMARRGVVVVRLQAIEALAGVDTVILDKTGTVTTSDLQVAGIRTATGITEQEALALAGLLAARSRHPVAQALATAHRGRSTGVEQWEVLTCDERRGEGLVATVHRPDQPEQIRDVRLGSASFCGVQASISEERIHLVDQDGWLASFTLGESVRADAMQAVRALRQMGIDVQLLSGDRDPAVQEMGHRLGIPASGGCTPESKLSMLKQLQTQGRRVAMVGDGINDAPALAHAHVSFAVGNAVPLARSQADLVSLGDRLMAIPQAIESSRRALRAVRQNLGWAVAYNVACVPLAVLGLMPPWLAGLGMACSSLVVVLNAGRLARPIQEPS